MPRIRPAEDDVVVPHPFGPGSLGEQTPATDDAAVETPVVDVLPETLDTALIAAVEDKAMRVDYCRRSDKFLIGPAHKPDRRVRLDAVVL